MHYPELTGPGYYKERVDVTNIDSTGTINCQSIGLTQFSLLSNKEARENCGQSIGLTDSKKRRRKRERVT